MGIILNKLGFEESIQKRKAWLQSDRGKASISKANLKYRKSVKGQLYALKEKEIRRIARAAIKAEKAEDEAQRAEEAAQYENDFQEWIKANPK